MHRSDTTPLLDVAVFGIQTDCPNISEEIIENTRNFLQMLISGLITYETCKEKVGQIAGQSGIDAVNKVNDILNVPETPLNEQSLNNDVIKRRAHSWSPEEDKRLLHGITKFGLSNWADISKFVGNGRSRSQCSQRWHRSLNPRICKDRWSIEDDQKLEQLVQFYGDHSWTKVAQALGSRADVQCRYRYQLILRRKQAQQSANKPKIQFAINSKIGVSTGSNANKNFAQNPVVLDSPRQFSYSQFQTMYLTHGVGIQQNQTQVQETSASVPQIQANSIFSEFVETEQRQQNQAQQQQKTTETTSSDSIFDDSIWENIFTNDQGASNDFSDTLVLF